MKNTSDWIDLWRLLGSEHAGRQGRAASDENGVKTGVLRVISEGPCRMDARSETVRME